MTLLLFSIFRSGKEPLCKIPLREILAVERLHEDSFKMKNMFQIVQRQRALYVQASNCVEEKEWIDILTKICQTNSNRLEKYHPSAYINGHWLWWLFLQFLDDFFEGITQKLHDENHFWSNFLQIFSNFRDYLLIFCYLGMIFLMKFVKKF